MRRTLPALLLLALAAAGTTNGRAANPPLSPDDECATFRLADDRLAVELVAAEPLIEAPVACQFDERGRLWVVEMRDYPTGPKPGESPLGRIKLLEDKDGDGRYDTATVFAEHVSFGNGLFVWKDGVIVTAAPHVLYLRDTDGDGKADTREILYEGFSEGNPQLRVSHPILGPDGWVYAANGLRGGQVRRHGKPNLPTVDISGKDFRFDPADFDRFEAVSGMGQYGNTFDRWGRRFVCDNRQHVRHIVFPLEATTRNPYLAVPAVAEDIGYSNAKVGHGAKVYPLTKNFTTASSHAGHFTAACGVFVYDGGLLPDPHAGAVLTCEPTGNLVHEEKLSPKGATFTATPVYDGKEFLASTDDWFRPVFQTHDPDGALVIVDMYRAVIEHPQWMPPEVKNRPDLWLGKERGRIWRVVPKGFKRSAKPDRLAAANLESLVKSLGSANGWERTTAQRLILQMHDKAVVPLLKAALGSESPDARMRAGWLLERFGALDEESLVGLLSGKHSGVRENALQIASHRLSEGKLAGSSGKVVPAVRQLTLAGDPRVRFQAALTLGASEKFAADHLREFLNLLRTTGADPWTRRAVGAAVGHAADRLLIALIASGSEDRELRIETPGQRLPLPLRDIFREVSVWAGGLPALEPKAVAAITKMLAEMGAVDSLDATLIGLAEGMARRGGPNRNLLALFPTGSPEYDRVAGQLKRIAATAVQPAEDLPHRLNGIGVLPQLPWPDAVPILSKLIPDAEAPPELRLAAVRAAGKHPDPKAADLLLAHWREYTPALRVEAVEALLQSPARIAALLDAIEAGKVKPGDLGPQQVRRLVAVKDATLKARANKLLAAALPADRKEVLAKYQEALTLPGDVARGKAVFQKNCAGCHAVAGVGVNVGPNIADTLGKTPAQLLTDVLNPNQAIDANYVAYTVTTKDGKTLTGFIAAETASSLTLKRENDQTDTILRADIEEVKSSGLSLMPEGVERNITVREMADLLYFLKHWRYGDVPR